MRNRLLIFLICLIVSVLFLYPQLTLSQPNLLDIQETWSIGKDIRGQTLAAFSQNDRFRPLYFFQRTAENALFDYRNRDYFLFFALLLSVNLYLAVSLALKKVTTGSLFLLLSVILLSPVTVDAYWRIGTAENTFALVLLTGLALVLRRRYNAGFVFLCLLMLAKETAVSIIPVFIWWYWREKKRLHALLLSLLWLVYGIKIYFLIMYSDLDFTAYVSRFSPEVSRVLDMAAYYVSANLLYFFMLSVSLVTVIHGVWRGKPAPARVTVEHTFIGMLAVSSIFPLFFFYNKFQPYYFLPTLCLIVILFFRSVNTLAVPLRITLYVVTAGLFVILGIGPQTGDRALYWHNWYVGDGVLVQYLRRQSDAVRYYFDRFYRPEYNGSLDFFYGTVSPSSSRTATGTISRSDLGTPRLCGRNFWGEDICRWSVAPYE